MDLLQVKAQLEDLKKDRESFLEEDGIGDEIFKADIKALEIAIELLGREEGLDAV
ncbi:MAG: hypothetical protein GX974_04000 [Clostridiales bacterium]|nr:hypothetical protein [Clostridiales bacterium]